MTWVVNATRDHGPESPDSVRLTPAPNQRLTRILFVAEMKTMPIGAAILVISLAVAVKCAAQPEDRPQHWAQPFEVNGVPNLFKVSDSLYRSAQPKAEGMQNLRASGIVTIVNLRSFHSDRDEIGSTGLAYEHIYMKAWHPERKEAVRFLQVVTDPKRTPVLVHCQYGADRTGIMIALYRVAVQGWSKDDAVREMTEGAFGFNEIWTNLPDWVRNLDIDAIRSEAGIIIDKENTDAREPVTVLQQESSNTPRVIIVVRRHVHDRQVCYPAKGRCRTFADRRYGVIRRYEASARGASIRHARWRLR